MVLKEIPKISCIYKIVNTVNKKYYLGSTVNLYNRMAYHFNHLRKGTHVNDYLQASFDKYGEKCFKVVIVEKCNDLELLDKEQLFLNKLPGRDKCFNIATIAGGGDNYTNHPNKEEIYKKLVKILKEIHQDPTKQPDFKGKKNPNYGNRWSQEQKENSSKKAKARFLRMTEEEKEKLSNRTKDQMAKLYESPEGDKLRAKFSKDRKGKKNAFYNKKHSKKSLKQMSESHKGQIPNNRKKVNIEGIIYESIHQAAKTLQMNMTTVFHRIKSSNPKFINWTEVGTHKKVLDKKRFNPKGNPLIIEGKKYKSATEASKEYKVTNTTILYRVRSESPQWSEWNWLDK